MPGDGVATVEPTRFVQGTTVVWCRSLADYKAGDGWSLAYAFRGNGAGRLDVTAAASGDDFLVTVTATASAAVPTGRYEWQGFVSKAGERYVVGTGVCEVTADFALAPAGFDTRSHAVTVLEAVEAAIEGRATKTQKSYTIGGRSIEHFAPADLLDMRDRYRREVAMERRRERVRRGLKTNRTLRVRFGG